MVFWAVAVVSRINPRVMKILANIKAGIHKAGI